MLLFIEFSLLPLLLFNFTPTTTVQAQAPAPKAVTGTYFRYITPFQLKIGSIGAGSYELNIPVANVGGIARNVIAIYASIRVFNAQVGGYLTGYPSDQGMAVPNISSVNWYATGAREVTNSSIIRVSPSGFINLFGGGTTDYVIEVFGYIDDNPIGGVYKPIAGSFRVYDSRPSGTNVPDPPQGVGAGTFSPGQAARTINIWGQLGIPNSPAVTGVIVNITASNQNLNIDGYFSPFINGSAPGVKVVTWQRTSINTSVARDVANLMFLQLNGAGQIQIAAGGGTAHLIVDIVGYIERPSLGNNALNSGLFYPLETSQRLYDSRATEPIYPGSAIKGVLGPNQTRTITARGVLNIPAGATALVLRITTANPTGGLFLAMYPGPAWPGNSNVNTNGVGQQIANLAIVGISGANNIIVRNGHPANSTDFTLDVVGYIAGCVTDPYLVDLAWPNNYASTFYWDGSVPPSLNNDIARGLETWNTAPFRSPVFTLSVNVGPNKVEFTNIGRGVPWCGVAGGAFACSNVRTDLLLWITTYNSAYDFIREGDPFNNDSVVAGHIMNHEYGHVMTLNHNDNNSANANYTYDSLLPNAAYRSDNRTLGVVKPRGCGDNQALYNRYGSN